MADRKVILEGSNGLAVPVKYIDLLDGTYAQAVSDAGAGGGSGGGPATIANGADASQGAIADTPWSLTGNSTVIAALKALGLVSGAQADPIAGADLTDDWSQNSNLKGILDRLRLTLSVDDADTQIALAALSASIGSQADSAAIGNVVASLIAHTRHINQLETAFTDVPNGRINAALATALDKVNDEVAAVLPQCTLAEADLASTTVATAVAAPAAGSHLEIYRLQIQSLADGAQDITWREGTGGSDLRKTRLLTNGSIISARLSGSWHLATATALAVKASAVTSVHWLVEYRTVLDSARA